MAYPAAIGFVWLAHIGQHGRLLGFTFIWLLGAGVSIRVYAQLLRLCHGTGYYPTTATSLTPTRPLPVRAGLLENPVSIEVREIQGPETVALANRRSPTAFDRTVLIGSEDLQSPTSAEKAEWVKELEQEWAKAEAKLARANSDVRGGVERRRRAA